MTPTVATSHATLVPKRRIRRALMDIVSSLAGLSWGEPAQLLAVCSALKVKVVVVVAPW